MLTAFKKICPLLSLAIATIGCGKKIEESKTSPSRQTEYQGHPSAYVLRLDGSLGSKVKYRLPDPATFEIPDRLVVRAGSTAGKSVEVSFDVNEYDSDDFEFKCFYHPSSVPSEMELSKCVDYDNQDLGNVTDHRFGLYKNDIIELKFSQSPGQDLVVEAIFGMDWF